MLNSVRRICKTLNQARLYIPERCVHCAYVCVILSPSCTLDIRCVSFCLSSCAVCVRCVQRCVSCHHRVWCAYVVCNVVCRCVIIGCGVRMLYVALSPLCVLYIRCVSFCRHRVCCAYVVCHSVSVLSSLSARLLWVVHLRRIHVSGTSEVIRCLSLFTFIQRWQVILRDFAVKICCGKTEHFILWNDLHGARQLNLPHTI